MVRNMKDRIFSDAQDNSVISTTLCQMQPLLIVAYNGFYVNKAL